MTTGPVSTEASVFRDVLQEDGHLVQKTLDLRVDLRVQTRTLKTTEEDPRDQEP